MTELEHEFDAAIMRLHRVAKEIGYHGTYFLRMLHEHGRVETARRLVTSNAPSEGFVRLWELGRLDLTAEKLVTEGQYRSLFSAQDGDRRASGLRVRLRLTDAGS